MANSSPEIRRPPGPTSTSNDSQTTHIIVNGSAVPEKTSETSSSEISSTEKASNTKITSWRKAYNILTYTPKRCRYDPNIPFQFSLSLNLLFAFAACFTVRHLPSLVPHFLLPFPQSPHIWATNNHPGRKPLLHPPNPQHPRTRLPRHLRRSFAHSHARPSRLCHWPALYLSTWRHFPPPGFHRNPSFRHSMSLV